MPGAQYHTQTGIGSTTWIPRVIEVILSSVTWSYDSILTHLSLYRFISMQFGTNTCTYVAVFILNWHCLIVYVINI